jgi:uncharacterized membrane protein YedE/YeeE
MALLQGAGVLKLSPKKAIPFGKNSKYGGNIIGGLLIGVGMALSGACPGTVLVQAIQGVPSGIYAAFGAILGGYAYSVLKRIFQLDPPAGTDTKSPSVPATLGISPLAAYAGYEVMCAAVLGLSSLATTSHKSAWPVDPILGGLIIGGAQITSLLLRGVSVGVSSVFGDTAENTLTLLSSSKNKTYAWEATKFATGLMAGSYVLTSLRPELIAATPLAISPAKAFLGGLVMSVGARHASGCTSGHGLSGMAQLQVSSFITTAAMFGGGIAVALLA